MNPYKKTDLDQLEEFYLSYRYRKLKVVIGLQDINEGPLLQRRDTRMEPFVYKGIRAGYQVDSLIRLTGSFFSHVSPRGMMEWYSICESIGLLNSGKTEDGSSLHYHDAVRKVFLIEQGITWKGRKEWELELWNYQLTGLMHTIWSEWNMSKGKWVFGFQYVQQFADGKQHTLPAESRYFPTNSSQTVAAKVGRDLGRSFSWSVSSTHGIGKGLFLFPRELNRDAFYSSIARSRLDGNGLEHVYLFKIDFRPHKIDWEQWSSRLEVQYSDLAPRSDALHNKYALPDYIQVNVDIKYRFKGILKGLDMEFLYVLRSSRGMDGITLPERFNKTDFNHFNLIINIVF